MTNRIQLSKEKDEDNTRAVSKISVFDTALKVEQRENVPTGRRKLHIFNPDTDYALASARRYYTPPAHVVKLRKELALLPALWASKEDAILLIDDFTDEMEDSELAKICKEKEITVLDRKTLKSESESTGPFDYCPWGWNLSIRQFLFDIFGNDNGLPTEESISRLRELSHRRTTIDFFMQLPCNLVKGLELPQEIFSVDEAMEHYEKNKELYFKAPWSSSGRGILFSGDLEARHVKPWIRGIIKRQGSVVMEKAYNRALDFATEWQCRDGETHFLGYSVFNTSRRGKYHGNISATQEELEQIILKSSRSDLSQIVSAQKEAIDKIISPAYEGPLGIDLLVTNEGVVNPCVEINLRHTMGMIGLL